MRRLEFVGLADGGIVGPVAGGLLYGLSAEAAYAVAALLMLVAGAAGLRRSPSRRSAARTRSRR